MNNSGDFVPGDDVVYTGTNGYPSDHDKARIGGLHIGSVYRVKGMCVADFSTGVRLEGIDGWHNSVLFERRVSTPMCCQSVAGLGSIGPSLTLSAPVTVTSVTDAPDTDQEYFVTASIQTVVRAHDAYGAMLDLKERLNDLIASGYAPNDPIHGTVIDSVNLIPVVE